MARRRKSRRFLPRQEQEVVVDGRRSVVDARPRVKVVTWARRRQSGIEVPYAEKFARLIQICGRPESLRPDAILIESPEALGDTYDEVIESLRRLSRAELALVVLPARSS